MIVAGRKNPGDPRVTNDNHVAARKTPEAAAATGTTIRTERRANRVSHFCVRCQARWILAVGFVAVRASIVLAVEREQDNAVSRCADRGARSHCLGADANVRPFV